MIYLLNEHGYLNAGFHEMQINDFKTLFVDSFPESNTRNKIFQGYLSFCEFLSSHGVINYFQWIDGSFCTSKTNPNDIDVVTFISYDELNNRSPQQQQELIGIANNRNLTKLNFNCDSFVVPIPPPTDKDYPNYTNWKMYWRGVWGFDRSDIPKGIVKIVFCGGIKDE